jgi:hypothetical protein
MRRAARLLTLGALAFAGGALAGEESILLIDAPGHDLTTTSCSRCHSLDYIPMNAPVMSRASWEKTVRKMVDKFGAPIAQADIAQILDYLTAHYSG